MKLILAAIVVIIAVAVAQDSQTYANKSKKRSCIFIHFKPY